MAPRSHGGGGSQLMGKLQTAIVDTERLGELFLDVRRQKIDCDRRRQAVREALTALRKSPQDKTWVLRPGGILVKCSPDKARAVLEQDQKDIETKLEALRVEEKRLTRLLADQGATPESIGPGMLNAMLNLKDTKPQGRGEVREQDLYELD